MPTLRRIASRIEHHWFAPEPLLDLGIVRAVIFFSVAVQLVHYQSLTMDLARASGALFTPLPALKVLLLPLGWGARPSAELLNVLWWIGLVSAVLATAGWMSRVTTILAAAGLTLVVAHYFSYGEQHHADAILVIAAWAVAAAPSGAAFSLDAYYRRRRGIPPPAPSPEARWPLRIVQWVFVIAYLSAATSKLVHGGLAWMNGYTLAYYFMQDGVRWNIEFGLALASWPHVAQFLSIGAVAFEASFILAVMFPRIAWVYLLTGVMMHTTVYLTQRAPFFQWLYVYIVFIEALRCYGPAAALWRRIGPGVDTLIAGMEAAGRAPPPVPSTP